jgi:drug/metabolite transporter (DMT)-like permease
MMDINEEDSPSYSSSRSSSSGGAQLVGSPGSRSLLGAFQDAVWPGDSSLLLLLLLRGLLGAIAVGGLYAGVGMLPLQTAVTLFFCTPAFAVLFDFLMAPRSIQLSTSPAAPLGARGVVHQYPPLPPVDLQ